MSEVCVEFSQNAWRKDLCSNCLRPRSEHTKVGSEPAKSTTTKSSSGRGTVPIPAKRNSTLTRSTKGRSKPVYDKNANEKQASDEDVKLLGVKSLTDDHHEPPAANSVENETESRDRTAENPDDPDNHSLNIPPPKERGFLKSSLKSSCGRESNKNQRVVIAKSEPEVIGYDGGVDYLFFDEETPEAPDSSQTGAIQLTEEEKQFALLALENTLWNSDIHNLRVETPIEGRLKRVPSKEFEDIELEYLWEADRFTGLKECDPLPKKFGTFPCRSRNLKSQLPSRPSIEFLLDPNKSPENDIDFRFRSGSDSSSSLYQSNGPKHGATVNVMAQSMTEDTSRLKSKHSSPHRSTELLPKPAPKPHALKKSTIELAEKPVPTARHKEDREKNRQHVMSRSVEGRLEDCSDRQDITESDTLKRQKPPAPAKRQHVSKDGTLPRRDEMSSSFAGTLERKYERDDTLKVDASDTRFSKAKSVDFEAKMASVAATLDFNKTKGKRQAPQAPVSPLHDSTASPSKSPAKNIDPGSRKSLSVEQARRSTLSDEGEPLDSTESYKSKNNESRMKKGFTSMFRSFLRRGRDSSSDSSTEQSFDNPSTQGKGNETSKDIPAIMCDNKTDLANAEYHNSDENPSGQFRVRVFPSPTKSIVSVASTASSTSNEGLDSRTPSEITPSDNRLENQDRQKDSGEEQVDSNPSSRKSTMSHESVHGPNSVSSSSDNVEDVVVVRRRVKSPKKMPAPNAPNTTARVAPSSEKNALFARELEHQLSKAVVENKTGTLKKTAAPKPPEPPPPLPDGEGPEKNATSAGITCAGGTSTATVTPSSSSQESGRQDSVADIRTIERIELPKAAQSRRSFLGKFAGNRRSRPPPPPVKRAKSITEASLPIHETHMKKIDLADISAPVVAPPSRRVPSTIFKTRRTQSYNMTLKN